VPAKLPHLEPVIQRHQASLVKSVLKKEQKITSGTIHEARILNADRKWYTTNKTSHSQNDIFHFAHHFFENKIIDHTMITKLRKGAKMLSVGTGAGHLERTLLRFSVPIENIDVADIKLHPDIQKTRFKKIQFDLTKKWPETEQYDYIIFPESLSCATYDEHKGVYSESNGQFALQQAYDKLRPGGEIRVLGDMGPLNTFSALEDLMQDNPGLRFVWDEKKRSIIIKKPN
jgi:hypothetical protein